MSTMEEQIKKLSKIIKEIKDLNDDLKRIDDVRFKDNSGDDRKSSISVFRGCAGNVTIYEDEALVDSVAKLIQRHLKDEIRRKNKEIKELGSSLSEYVSSNDWYDEDADPRQ